MHSHVLIYEGEKIQVIEELKVDFKIDYNKLINEVNLKGSLRESIELRKLYDDINMFFSKLAYKNNYRENKEIYTYLNDVTFRLFESSQCLMDVCKCDDGFIYKMYPFPDFIINKQYFTYASIFLH